jgi:hypothetical protein
MSKEDLLLNYVLLALQTRTDGSSLSYLAIKPHGTHSLFFASPPLNWREEDMRSVFEVFGEVETLVLHQTKKSGMVKFSESQAQRTALSAASTSSIVEFSPSQDSDEPAGLKAWLQQHKEKAPSPAELQRRLDDWVAAYEEEEAAEERQKKANMSEDGWTVVVRQKGRAKTTEEGGASVRGGGVSQAAALEMKKASDKKAVESNFYTFQQRDKRRNELLALREKFDKDRKRIQELRSTRKF